MIKVNLDLEIKFFLLVGRGSWSVQIITDLDPGGQETYGSGSRTLQFVHPEGPHRPYFCNSLAWSKKIAANFHVSFRFISKVLLPALLLWSEGMGYYGTLLEPKEQKFCFVTRNGTHFKVQFCWGFWALSWDFSHLRFLPSFFPFYKRLIDGLFFMDFSFWNHIDAFNIIFPMEKRCIFIKIKCDKKKNNATFKGMQRDNVYKAKHPLTFIQLLL